MLCTETVLVPKPQSKGFCVRIYECMPIKTCNIIQRVDILGGHGKKTRGIIFLQLVEKKLI